MGKTTYHKIPRSVLALGVTVEEYVAALRDGKEYCVAAHHEGDRRVDVGKMDSSTTNRCTACVSASVRKRRSA